MVFEVNSGQGCCGACGIVHVCPLCTKFKQMKTSLHADFYAGGVACCCRPVVAAAPAVV